MSETQWQEIKVGNGEKIDLVQDGPFTGIFLGFDEIRDVVNPATGVKESAPTINFTDEDGNALFLWATYQLTEALGDVDPGTLVRITHLGKTELKGGRTVNRYRVEVGN